jgi:hypothetical protein
MKINHAQKFQCVKITTVRSGAILSLGDIDLPNPISRGQQKLYCTLFAAGMGGFEKVLLINTGTFAMTNQEA